MTSKPKRYLNLSVFLQLYGTQDRAWQRPGAKAGGNPDLQKWASMVQTLERGKFDYAFLADFVGNAGSKVGEGRMPRGGNFEPLTLIAALATLTQKIGLVATVNTNFNEPYNLARRFASLDHLSGGRVGWNVVSSLADNAAKTFGVKDPAGRDGRYGRAAEFIDVAKKLWDSWDDGAFDHPDAATGKFYSPQSGHPVSHQGEHFAVDSILDIARPVQGYPVLFQAGNSEEGREFAAEYAEVIYAAAQTLEEAQSFYSDVKGRMAKYGREPDQLKVTPGLHYHIGHTRQEAQEKYEAFRDAVELKGERLHLRGIDVSGYDLDQPLPDNLPEPVNGLGRFRQMVALSRRENLSIRELLLRFEIVHGHRIVVGTPADIADQLEDWFVHGGADGFNLRPSFTPDSINEFVDLVVPELQRRGLVRTEYEGNTLREHLGLTRPQNSNALARSVTAAE